MRRRCRPEEPHPSRPSHERWMVSYADFVTLLLAFFVTMYAITRLDAEKLSQAQLSIQRALHAPVFLGGFPLVPGVGKTPAAGRTGDLTGAVLQADPPPQLEEVARTIQRSLTTHRELADIRLLITGRGLVIHLPEFVFFNSGEADLRPESLPLLDKLAAILAQIPNHVAIEGHTDNRPIHTAAFPSNWELSTHRATSLVRYFIETHHLDPRRFSAAGYGEYAPVADNSTEAGRRLNRRVDVIIKPLVNRPGGN
ncbi:MAG: OmpA family protein [Deltaproteobacteria bacterium]|nr:OmpA family protein [Deltaproteobacteria bacterium]